MRHMPAPKEAGGVIVPGLTTAMQQRMLTLHPPALDIAAKHLSSILMPVATVPLPTFVYISSLVRCGNHGTVLQADAVLQVVPNHLQPQFLQCAEPRQARQVPCMSVQGVQVKVQHMQLLQAYQRINVHSAPAEVWSAAVPLPIGLQQSTKTFDRRLDLNAVVTFAGDGCGEHIRARQRQQLTKSSISLSTLWVHTHVL